MYKLFLKIAVIFIFFSLGIGCNSNQFSLNEEYFNESIVGYYLGALDMNTGSTNISLFRYSIRENNNCYQNQSSLRLKFSFKIYSPTLGFYSLRELMSGEIALDNIVGPIIISNNDIDFSTTSVPGASFNLINYNGPTDYDSPELTAIISSILQSGKIPNGTYSFNFSLLNESGQLIDELTKSIEVYEPSYISLVSPGGTIDDISNSVIFSSLPSFFWQMDYCSNCDLGIRVCEYDPSIHNSLIDAISSLSMLPVSSYEEFHPINDSYTSFQYPAIDAQQLHPGRMYAWQLKRTYNTTIGTSHLLSPIYLFQIANFNANKTKDPNIDQIRLIIGDEKFESIFGSNGTLEGYDYNLKSISSDINSIDIEELYSISAKFNNGSYKLIEVIIE